MFKINLSNDFPADAGSTSEGTQDKYFLDGYWYKTDRFGGEASAEVLSSAVLSCSSLKPGDYVVYEDGWINGLRGCRSRDFLRPGENLVTLYRFHQQVTGQKINEMIRCMDRPEDRAAYTLDFFRKYAGIDLTNYFQKIFTIDLFNLNEDRHFNNLAIIRRADGTCCPAPVFDNGKSLFIDNYSVRQSHGIAENRKRIIARPFSASCETQYAMFPQGFTVDFEKCADQMKKLSTVTRNSEQYMVMLDNLSYVRIHHPELDVSQGLSTSD